MPAYLSLGFYDFEFGLYWLSQRGHAFLRELLQYVQASYPWYDRRGGADHVLVMTNDKGATFIRGSVPALAKVCLVCAAIPNLRLAARSRSLLKEVPTMDTGDSVGVGASTYP